MHEYRRNHWLKYEAMTEEQRAEASKLESKDFMRKLGQWLGNELFHGDKHRLNNIVINLGYYEYWLQNGDEAAKCACCGLPILKWRKDTCTYCDFWLQHLAELRKPMEYGHSYKVIREGGEVISFKEGIVQGQWLGYAGRQFYFRLTENDVVTSNNVWSAGELPVELRDLVKHRVVTTISKEEYDNACKK